jgi:hypothetical protein
MGRFRHAAVQYPDFAVTEFPHAGDKRQQGGFADTIRPDYSHHDPRRNVYRDVVEHNCCAVAVRYVPKPGNDCLGHWGSRI